MNLVIPNSMVTPSYAMGYARSQSESANPGLWDGLVTAYVPGLGLTGNRLLNLSDLGSSLDISSSGAWRQTKNGPSYWDHPLTSFNTQVFDSSNVNHTIIVHAKITNVGESGILQQYSSGQVGRMGFAIGGATTGVYYSCGIDFRANESVAVGDYVTVGLVHKGTNAEIFWNGESVKTSGSMNNGVFAIDTELASARDIEIIALYIYKNIDLTQSRHMEIAHDPLAAFRRKDQTIYLPSATAGFNRRYYDAFIARSA